MTIKKLVELINLAINGGVLSPDSSVLRADIRAMLPMAVNSALDRAYNSNREIEGDGSLPSQFYGFFGPIKLNTAKFPYTFDLEKGTVPLKAGYGIKNVVDDLGNVYSPIPDFALPNLMYTFEISTGTNWYRRIGKKKIEIYSHNDLLSDISYQSICDVEELDDDDDVPIQAGQEEYVLGFLIRHFSIQKGNPYDNAADNKDDINSSR